MTLGQKLDRERKELIDEVTEKDMYIFLNFLLTEGTYSKEKVFLIMEQQYPKYEIQYTAFINEHWKEA